MAGDSNSAAHVYPDQSLYPSNSVPLLVERINNALQRADQVLFCHRLQSLHVLIALRPLGDLLLHENGVMQQLVRLVPVEATDSVQQGGGCC